MRERKNVKFWLILFLIILVVLPGGRFLLLRLEGESPSIIITPSILSIGETQTLDFSVSDKKSGIRKIWIGLIKEGKEAVLYEETFSSKDSGKPGAVNEKSFNILIEPRKLGFSDGKAILRTAAWDYSWRGWWHGNKTYIETSLLIDTNPPDIEVLTRMHNISQGGSGLVIYKISETCPENGVFVGENFFPGHLGYFEDDTIYIAFFALAYNQGPGTKIFVKSTDRAGNSTRAGFPYYIRKKTFKKDLILISDRFLNWKMPEFKIDMSKDQPLTNLEKFIRVNRELREANYNEITHLGKQTEETLYWEGPFLRFPNSARRAGFADHREYRYNGRKIDEQVHLGIDLASVQRAPVPAGNKGRVVFAGYIGIYGKTVLIDHGYGLFSMYSHLSHIDVEAGQVVSRGEVIGKTGTTGLAAGDHLHFGMLLHNRFVNPVEWWDANWINHNVKSKLETVKSGWN